MKTTDLSKPVWPEIVMEEQHSDIFLEKQIRRRQALGLLVFAYNGVHCCPYMQEVRPNDTCPNRRDCSHGVSF